MKREIKFRAFIESTLGDYMAIQGEPDLETLGSFMHHYSSCKNIMQFTGLFDKNGKEIYEGDICKHKEDIAKIIFWEGAFIFNKYATHNYSLTNFDCCRTFEVLGNIYENSELLTK